MRRSPLGVTVPPAYTLLADGPVRAAIRSDLIAVIAPWLLACPLVLPPDSELITGAGRGGAYRGTLTDGRRVVVRPYRRGGFVARFVRESYLGWRPRPLTELLVTSEARRRGVAAAEVLAARIEGGLLYRGALVTAEIPDARTLLDALRGTSEVSARCALAASTGRALAVLHGAGVAHADLNVTNILVHGDHPSTIVLVDFDRARLQAGPLGQRARRRNLRRLAGSLAKADPGGRLIGPAERDAFCAAYGDGACGS